MVYRRIHSMAVAVGGILVVGSITGPVLGDSRVAPGEKRVEVKEEAKAEDGQTLAIQRKRVVRWTVVFKTDNGDDYLKQLRFFGAILAVPDENGAYQVIRDLTQKPAKGKIEDLAKVNRIFWIDEKKESVAALAKALQLKAAPPHVVAFFPQKFEKELLEKELKYRGRKEDEIERTKFKVVKRGDKYDVEVVAQRPTKADPQKKAPRD